MLKVRGRLSGACASSVRAPVARRGAKRAPELRVPSAGPVPPSATPRDPVAERALLLMSGVVVGAKMVSFPCATGFFVRSMVDAAAAPHSPHASPSPPDRAVAPRSCMPTTPAATARMLDRVRDVVTEGQLTPRTARRACIALIERLDDSDKKLEAAVAPSTALLVAGQYGVHIAAVLSFSGHQAATARARARLRLANIANHRLFLVRY